MEESHGIESGSETMFEKMARDLHEEINGLPVYKRIQIGWLVRRVEPEKYIVKSGDSDEVDLYDLDEDTLIKIGAKVMQMDKSHLEVGNSRLPPKVPSCSSSPSAAPVNHQPCAPMHVVQGQGLKLTIRSGAPKVPIQDRCNQLTQEPTSKREREASTANRRPFAPVSMNKDPRLNRLKRKAPKVSVSRDKDDGLSAAIRKAKSKKESRYTQLPAAKKRKI